MKSVAKYFKAEMKFGITLDQNFNRKGKRSCCLLKDLAEIS